jgi:hypothetical protein
MASFAEQCEALERSSGGAWRTETFADALGARHSVLRADARCAATAAAVVASSVESAGHEFPDGDDDDAAAARPRDATHGVFDVSYYVSMSPTFGVPVVEFTVAAAAPPHAPIMDSEQLRQQLWPALNVGRDVLDEAALRGPLVSGVYSELLERAVFAVHACDTKSLLEQHASAAAASRDVGCGSEPRPPATLAAVLGLVGPFVGMPSCFCAVLPEAT